MKTADGQILTNEEGNPITSNLKPATAPAVPPATPAPRNNLVGDAVAAAGLGAEELGSGFQLNTSAVTSAGPTAYNYHRVQLPAGQRAPVPLSNDARKSKHMSI